MERLPNAPLIEVIFEIRWPVKNTDLYEMQKCQYLHGDLYALLKDQYKYRESLVPPDFPMETYLNKPAHRFRAKKNGYPGVQVGPGIVTLNTIDELYDWAAFEKQCLKLSEKLFDVYSFKKEDQLQLALKYFDFFNFDFQKDDATLFLKNKLHIEINQNFYDKNTPLSAIGIALQYQTDIGNYLSSIGKKTLNNKDGLLLQHSMTGKHIKPDLTILGSWLGKAHDVCSTAFKNMTKGELYESFK